MRNIGKILKVELERRKRNNSAYSLRSFAKFLDVSPATLSQIISGKRGVSMKTLNSIMDKLGLTPEEQSRTLKVLRKRKKNPEKSVTLKEDQFRVISDWYHYAILSLAKLKNCKADPRWIARRLNIRVEDANQALNRLQRLHLISIENGEIKRIESAVKSTDDIPSSSLRKFHKGVLGIAQNRIDLVPVDKREYRAVTMAINSKNIEEAKKLTREFKDDMMNLLEDGEADEVYQLSVQLFPLTLKD